MSPFDLQLAETPLQTLLARVPKNAPPSVSEDMRAAFTSAVVFSQQAAAIRDDHNLTKPAKDAAVQRLLRTETFVGYDTLKGRNSRLESDVKAHRDALRSGTSKGLHPRDVDALEEASGCLSAAIAVAMMMVERESGLNSAQFGAARG